MKFDKIDNELITDLINSGDREIIFICDYLKVIKKETSINKHLGHACLELALMGDIRAMHTISIIFSYGLMCKQNKNKALYWCIKSVNENYYPSLLTLSEFYEQGWAGLKRNCNKAIELIKKSALNNFLPAITMMGLCYETGEIIKKDIQKSIVYFKQAANLGDEMSMWFLSVSLLLNPKIYNKKEGVYWLKKSAKNNCPFAHNTIAYFYLDGVHGFEKNQSLFQYHLDIETSLKKELVNCCLEGLI